MQSGNLPNDIYSKDKKELAVSDINIKNILSEMLVELKINNLVMSNWHGEEITEEDIENDGN